MAGQPEQEKVPGTETRVVGILEQSPVIGVEQDQEQNSSLVPACTSR
jgi:hypothetical protein